VADVAAERPDGWGAGGGSARPPFYRLADLRLRGLLHLLRDDPRVQTFVERELGPLLAAEPGSSLLDVLSAYFAAGGNKAEAAKNAHLARPTFYERLRRIERILGTDLGSAESRTIAARGAAGPGGLPAAYGLMSSLPWSSVRRVRRRGPGRPARRRDPRSSTGS